MREVIANPRPCCLCMTTGEWQRSYELAKATLHENHINDLILGTADSKLVPIRKLDGSFYSYRVNL